MQKLINVERLEKVKEFQLKLGDFNKTSEPIIFMVINQPGKQEKVGEFSCLKIII